MWRKTRTAAEEQGRNPALVGPAPMQADGDLQGRLHLPVAAEVRPRAGVLMKWCCLDRDGSHLGRDHRSPGRGVQSDDHEEDRLRDHHTDPRGGNGMVHPANPVNRHRFLPGPVAAPTGRAPPSRAVLRGRAAAYVAHRRTPVFSRSLSSARNSDSAGSRAPATADSSISPALKRRATGTTPRRKNLAVVPGGLSNERCNCGCCGY